MLKNNIISQSLTQKEVKEKEWGKLCQTITEVKLSTKIMMEWI